MSLEKLYLEGIFDNVSILWKILYLLRYLIKMEDLLEHKVVDVK